MAATHTAIVPAPVATLRDGKTEAIARILSRAARTAPRRVLVVGCGSGLEAAILAQELCAEVTGIDVDPAFDAEAAARVTLRRADATCMPFPDGAFDLVYSYHALEHIPDYERALSEMRRVLARGGTFCVGTPNRLRLVGYLGSKTASLQQKIRWNLDDWRARLSGRFRNEYGAHAGFSSEELRRALTRTFSAAHEITLPYYLEVYSGKARLVALLHAAGLARVLFPSVYFMGPR